MEKELITIGRRIKKYRELAGLTQQNVADQMNWSTNFVSRLETGKSMTSVRNLLKLSTILNTTIDNFFIDFIPDKSLDIVNTPKIQALLFQLALLDEQHIEYMLQNLELYVSIFIK